MKWTARGLVVLICALLVPLPAAAQESVGKQRFREATTAYEHGRYRDAARLFSAAYEADGHPELMYNVARAHDKAGDLASALQAYRRYLALSPGTDARAEVQARIRAIEAEIEPAPVLQGVQITSTPSGASVIVDGTRVGRTPWSGELSPGNHSLELRARGHAAVKRRMVVPPDRASAMFVELEALEADALVPASRIEPEPTTSSVTAEPYRYDQPLEPAVRPLTWVAWGVGVAAIGGAVGFELARRSSEEDAENARTQIEHQDHIDEMERRRTASIVLGAVGAAAIVTGTVLFAVDLNRDRRVGIGVGCGGGTCGVAASGSWP